MEKIKYIALDNLDSYKNLVIDKEDYVVCRQPLFHGTTRMAIDCDPEEIKRIHEQALIAIDVYKSYLEENEDKPGFQEWLHNHHKRFVNQDWTLQQVGHANNYQYGDFYVTANYLEALRFSMAGFGELGQMAYRCAVALKELNVDFGINETIDFIIDEYNRFQNSERVVLVLENVLFEDLLRESGEPLILVDENGESDYFDCEDLYNAKVSERMIYCKNYRVKNLNKYTLKLINKTFFKEGIGYFTQIGDVEKFLSKSRFDNHLITNAEFYGL